MEKQTQSVVPDGIDFIKRKDGNGKNVFIPFIDATGSPEARELAKQMLRQSNHSKYITRKYSFYGISYQDSQKEN